jgi:hypothetical protein
MTDLLMCIEGEAGFVDVKRSELRLEDSQDLQINHEFLIWRHQA